MNNFFLSLFTFTIDTQSGYFVLAVTGVVLLVMLLALNKSIGKAPKRAKRAAPAAPAAPVRAAAPKTAAAKAPAPVVEQGIPAEVVAVIAAAIAAMGEGKYVLRAVRRAETGRQSAWARAGVQDVTSPF